MQTGSALIWSARELMSWMICFGHVVARGRLGAEEEGLGREVHIGIVLQLLVQAHDVQHVEQLALILMQALDLYVEDGVGVEDDPGLPGHIARQNGACSPA